MIQHVQIKDIDRQLLSIALYNFILINGQFQFAEKYFEKKKVNETSSPFMKFPTDVKQAEYLTGGSPEIVDHERFQPKKATPAQSTYSFIFFSFYNNSLLKIL